MAANAAPLIWINGFPGSGKLTVAKALTNLHQNTILQDNHKLIDPVEARLSRTHPRYQEERKLQRQKAFDQYVYAPSTRSDIVIFTDFQSDNGLGHSVAREYQDAATRAGRPFIPVYLFCDLAENLERVNNSDRIGSGTKKLTEVDFLKELRSKCELFRFSDCSSLTLDSTNTPPLEAAAKILLVVEKGFDNSIS